MQPRPAAKKPTFADAVKVMTEIQGAPVIAERPEDPLLDHLLVGVLSLHAGRAKAIEVLRTLSASYLDFNELRVSPKNEIEGALAPFVPAERLPQAAWDLRMALQDVFDGTHGLDLEPLRGREPEDLRHFCTKLPNTPGAPAATVFQLAVGEEHLVLGPPEAHVLERLGLLPRASTPQRVRQAVERLVKPGERLAFAWAAGGCSRLFEKENDPSHPFGRLLIDCRAKELAERERQRKIDESRRKAEAKRQAIEAAKRARLEAIAQKKREAEEKRKAAVEAAKKKREEAAKAAAAKKAAEKARVLEAKKKKQEAERAAAQAKKAAEKARREKEAKEKAAAKAAAKAAQKKAQASKKRS